MSKQPNYVFDDETELYHHGIPNQKWGVRRFQNEDGSWTPEGRERYGEGGTKSKSDVQKYKAKVAYNTQKYKADLKLKAQKEKIVRAAKEEKARIKEQGKIDRAARKEQNKLDRKQARLDNKLAKEQAKAKDTATLKEKLVRTKRYAMSDDELERSINRLKLEVEYNKQYALAAKPNGALARADRFFEGPTGKFVTDVAVATLPKVAEQVAREASKSAFKYVNKEDRDKAAADVEKVRADAEKVRMEADEKRASAESTRQTMANDKAKSRSELRDAELKRRVDEENAKTSLWKTRQEVERENRKAENADRLAASKQRHEQKVKEEEIKGYDIKYKDQFGKTQTRHIEGSNERKNAQIMGFQNGMDHVSGSIERKNNQQQFDNQFKASVKERELAEAEKNENLRRQLQEDTHKGIVAAYQSGKIDISKASELAGKNSASTKIEYTKMSNDQVAIKKGNGIIQVVKEEELWPILQAAGRLR